MLEFFAALNRLTSLTPRRFAKLLKFFANDAEKIWHAEKSAWLAAGLEAKIVAKLWTQKAAIKPDFEFARLKKIGVQVVPITAEAYPLLLREIYDPPPVLLVRGKLQIPHFALAIVGTRRPSAYGRQATLEITRELAGTGVTIVSGLAFGIDALAHATALQVGGHTLAVLGSGIGEIYPSRNQQLAENILQAGGALISEYPLETEIAAYNFPQRNRIIAGLARGVVVVEARARSGSLITAKLALEQGREVFAVPGSIFVETSVGTNNLIAEGARPITSEILASFKLEHLPAPVQNLEPLTPREEAFLKILTQEPQMVDLIIQASLLPANQVATILSLLELKGWAKNLGGGLWVRV